MNDQRTNEQLGGGTGSLVKSSMFGIFGNENTPDLSPQAD